MKDTQTRNLHMGSRCLEGLDDNSTIWSTNPNATTKHDQLEDIIASIHAAGQAQQDKSSGGEADEKELARHNMTDLADLIGHAAAALALDTLDLVNYRKFHKGISALDGMKDAVIIEYCNSLHTYAFNNVGAIANYNIINTMISEFATSITDFSDQSEKPDETKGQRHTATLNVGERLRIMTGILQWFDLFVGTLRVSQPDFHSDWHEWRKINNSGVRHISIRGLVKDSVSNNPQFEAKISITNLTAPRFTYSGSKGNYRFFSLNPGGYDLKVELVGYQTLTFSNISVAEGKITDLNIALVRL